MHIQANFLQAILVTGDDRIAFLQGQLSCDMVGAENSVQLATMCNPKGRIIAIFHVICSKDAVYLIARADLIEPAATHLKRFIFRSKVQINHQHSVNIFLSNLDANSEAPVLSPGNVEETTEGTVRARLMIPNSIEIVLTSGAILSDQDTENHRRSPDAELFWSQQMHRSGIPEITLEQTEKYLPEPLNLDLSGGINFDKGCYTGQEVIARMHYLGKAKKRLFRFTMNDSLSVHSEMPVFNQRGENIGEVFSSTPTDHNNSSERLGLAILSTPNMADGEEPSNTFHCWINETPGETNSIPVEVSFPNY